MEGSAIGALEGGYDPVAVGPSVGVRDNEGLSLGPSDGTIEGIVVGRALR